ncbi:DNA primase [Tuanshanicoccus lijuaniae]|uniref:DNA primase n=1 Tax=Aerococcaceae bacterium zg-1292 TaxID=2774330 RepID=UPI0019360874|nr:DNA primase [Aerococcaceae bacterium zg-1292]QQA36350.1 DNA primase [Aerococcaceae bacterium zg-1292]
MSYIPEEVIREVREKTDIVDVISQYVQLTKRGQNYSCSCPFHEDRNPSFSIHSGKQIFKCFSCGRGGNVFSFLQEMEGISFPEAVQKAAEFSNVSFDTKWTSQNSTANQTHQDLFAIHEKATDFYHYYLMETTNGEAGLQYLQQRQLDSQILERYQVGLSPENSQALYQYLRNEGFNDEQLINSGIFYARDNGELVDRFHQRLIFPLRNPQGKVVGFSGRVYQDDVSDAKYLNSPDTEIFQKNQLLFNMDLARLPIRQLKQVLVCEGFMDVIRLNQYGFHHAVATMGTSLTDKHLSQLSKMAQEIVFVFDGDEAGQKATNRAFEMSAAFHQQTFKSVVIPNRKDPDEFLQTNGEAAFRQLIHKAINRFEFQKQFLKMQYQLNDDHQVAQYIEQIVKLIATIDSPIEQELRIQDLSQEFGLSPTLIKEQVARQRSGNQQRISELNDVAVMPIDVSVPIPHEQKSVGFEVQSKRAYEAEKLIFQLLIFHQEAWEYLAQHNPTPIFYHEVAQNLFFELERDYYDKNLPLPLLDIAHLIEDGAIQQLYLTIMWDAQLFEYHEQVMHDCFHVIQIEFLKQEMQEWKERFVQYSREQRTVDAKEAMDHILRLARLLKK